MVYGHLVRRGLAVVRDGSSDFAREMPPPMARMHAVIQEIPQWGIATLLLTLLAGILLTASVRYTLQGIVTTLAMIESPQTTVIVREEKPKFDYTDALAEDAIDTEVLVIKQKPITASIRSTVHHLQARGGRLARWRGLSALLVWALAYDFMNQGIMSLFSPLITSPEAAFWVASPLASILSRVFLARLGLTWTHIVISAPSPKPWFRRVPSFKAWKQIAMPTLYNAAAWQLNLLMPAAVAYALNLHRAPSSVDEHNVQCMAMKLLAVAGIALVTFVGITIPAEVALTRVQASLLSDEDDSIVPFDRTFNGAVVPAVVGGSGKLGFLHAWRSFDGAARVRLLKLLVKVFAVDVALHLLVVMTLVMEFIAIVGPRAQNLVYSGEVQDSRAFTRYEAVVQ